MIDTYGEPINPSIPLENIIDHGNIHGWLSNQINIASVREAAFIKDLLDTNSGDEAVNVVTAILDAFAVQGQACGVVAQDNLEEHTAPAIYNALQNFYVNGMPCDGGDQVVSESPDEFTWVGDHRLQAYNYLTVYVVPRPIPCFLKKPDFTNLLTICNTFVFPNPVYSTNFLEGKALNCRISYIFFSSAVNLSKFCSMTGKMILIEFSEIYYIIKRAQKRT